MNDDDLKFVDRVETLAKRAFSELSIADVVLVCRMVREQDKRVRHVEAERDAFNTRIDELETELRDLRSQVGMSGGCCRDERHVAAWLRVVADHIEKGGSPYVFASDVPDRAPDKPCNEETIETFSVVLSKPWGG